MWLREEATGSGPPLPGSKEGAVGPVHAGRTWSCLLRAQPWAVEGQNKATVSGRPQNKEGIKIWDILVL